jgi:ribosomal protein S10
LAIWKAGKMTDLWSIVKSFIRVKKSQQDKPSTEKYDVVVRKRLHRIFLLTKYLIRQLSRYQLNS